MEQNERRFRLKLNLFDGIVILVALAVAAVLLYMQMKPAPTDESGAPASATMQYTVRLLETIPGTGDLVKPGDKLRDVVKNYDLGVVVSSRVMPATDSIIDEDTNSYVTAEIPGREDVEIIIEANATYGDESVLVGSGYAVRVGDEIFVRGPGYLGSGEVWAIERRK